jgi:acetyl esterase/lipase/NRPS condensation-like uncharacterized protein
MALSAKTIRAQMNMLQPLLKSCSLDTIRKGQDKIGRLMESQHRRQVLTKEHPFAAFSGAWIIPRDELRQGVILYLHGGGYVCGGLEYAKGFAATLAVRTGTRVFCAGYRLAPEHPFPAALEDALESYRYLLEKGYTGNHITLCGESAGGGLCYSLCRKLRELELPLPGGILAISPWTDLTASGASYESNREKDPSLSRELLDFFAGCFTTDPTDPLVSPLLGDQTGMPPSLLFAGGDEILLDDARLMHQKLTDAGCKSQLVLRPDRWHAYVLYCMEEDREDFNTINHFLDRHLAPAHKLRWLPLDNAAKIYPAARRSNWTNMFRLSATLTEDVDIPVLQSALDVTIRRFPSIAARLRRGMFWYYLQQLEHPPAIREENSYPLTRMSRQELRQCAFRVLVYHRRIALEIFHSLTDGNGAMIFLKTLVAEYLQQKYGLRITAGEGVLGRLEEPSGAELEDSFQKYAGRMALSRRDTNAWRISGTPEQDGFLHVTCLTLPVQQVQAAARSYQVSVTNFLAAAMMQALQNMQAEQIPGPGHRKPVKVLIPVNLRRLFPSRTLRNFAMYTIPEIDPRLGEYSFEEICRIVHHRMGMDITPKHMGRMIAANVNSERLLAVRLMPLFIKNIVMKAVFDAVGERKSCLSLSNLGHIRLPEEMMPYVQRMDFIVGVQATAPYNCGVLSFKDTLYINFIRNIREPDLEYHFFRVLRDLGLPVQVQSNRPQV